MQTDTLKADPREVIADELVRLFNSPEDLGITGDEQQQKRSMADYLTAKSIAALTASGLSIVPVATGDVVERVARAWASIDGKTEAFDREKDGSVGYDDPAHTGHYDGYMEEAKELLKRSGLASTLESLAAENARLDARATLISTKDRT